MTLRAHLSLALIACAALLFSACSSQMEPAQQAIAGIDSAIASASPDAARYVPDELAGVQAKLTDMKAAFDKQDYAGVLTGAPALLAEAQGLLGSAALKKETAVKAARVEWAGLAEKVTGLVATVAKRIAVLEQGSHLPAGADLAAAKTSLADATALWSKAQAAFAADNVEEAVASAKEVLARTAAAAASVKFKLPGAPAATQ